jgi:glycine/D-amino acid oxidase-like deaminating enzyme
MASAGHVAIVGGGVAGVTTALMLGHLGLRVTLLERRSGLVGGPPFCHLHAGGNLYREISDEQCVTLLRQSVAFARLYPFIVDRRPTVVAVPVTDPGSPEALFPRLRSLRHAYEKLVAADPANEVLGPPADYFTLFDEKRLDAAARLEPATGVPRSPEAWMAPLARHLKRETVKLPLVLVQEYGLNLFRLAGGAALALEAMANVDLMIGSEVAGVTREGEGFALRVRTETGERTVRADYLVNAAGYRTGTIDDMLGVRTRRMVEFKAAYVARWPGRERYWPEAIFHGRRGTPAGMAQFTPYGGGYVQLHGMTKDITLFEHGLVAGTEASSQPRLPEMLEALIEKGWPPDLVRTRTRRAIDFSARFISGFAEAEVGGPPLFGAQQIPGEDPQLRVAEVAFPRPRYARCEIVKVSSVTDMAEAIVDDLKAEGLCAREAALPPSLPVLESLEGEAIAARARAVARARGFPEAMADLSAG